MKTMGSLDLDEKAFEALLQESAQMVLNQFKDLDTKKAYHDYMPREVAAWFDESLPEEGMDLTALMKEVQEKVLDPATGNLGPHMYAYVMCGGTQMSIVSEQLSSTINQNIGKWHLAPSLTEIEKRVVQWAGEMLGLKAKVGGVMLSGGSAANLAGLTVARNIYFEQNQIRKKGLFGLKPMTVYASQEVHGCIDKSLEQLGMGTDYLRKIETNPDFTINVAALEDAILADQKAGLTPFCIIGTAGTVNTGAIDDLEALAALAKKYKLWFHVDGAYGGLVACLPSHEQYYKGLALADSVAIDFHKWLYQPFEAGCVLVQNWGVLRRAYFKPADYLDTTFEEAGRLDFNEYYFQLSRNTKALKVWMCLKAYGMSRFREMILKDIELTGYLAESVQLATDFELKSISNLAVCCFRYQGDFSKEEDIIRINETLIPALEKDGRVFITGTKLNGAFVIRACLINHRKNKEHIDYLLNVIRDVASKMEFK